MALVQYFGLNISIVKRSIFAEALSIQNVEVKNSYFATNFILWLLKTIVKFFFTGAMHSNNWKITQIFSDNCKIFFFLSLSLSHSISIFPGKKRKAERKRERERELLFSIKRVSKIFLFIDKTYSIIFTALLFAIFRIQDRRENSTSITRGVYNTFVFFFPFNSPFFYNTQCTPFPLDFTKALYIEGRDINSQQCEKNLFNINIIKQKNFRKKEIFRVN